MKKTLLFLSLTLLILLLTGCTTKVPMGYVGMKQTAEGVVPTPLMPGNHSCWGRDRMYLIETKEGVVTEDLKILCSDDLNFSFDLKIRSKPKLDDGKSIVSLLKNKGSASVAAKNTANTFLLSFNTLYKTYIQPEARSLAREVVSKYSTTQIREKREIIQKDIQTKLLTAIKTAPMKVTLVTASNFDYPEVITTAMNAKRKREIAIDEEKAKQAVKLLEAENRLKIAHKMQIVRAAEAKAEAVFFKIVGTSLNKNFLTLRNIEAKKALYDNVGKGDKVIVDAKASPLINVQ